MSTEKSVSAFPENENFFRWLGTIIGKVHKAHPLSDLELTLLLLVGPKDTPYEGQRYRLLLEFPNSYPYSPPVVTFVTKCFHPNIDLNGALCLDILKEKWSALYDVRTILLSIQSLLGEPNNDSPLNSQAASLWVDPAAYKRHLDLFYEKNKDS